MSGVDRVAFIACSGSTAQLQGGQGTLDGDAVRERLAQPDVAFDVQSLDVRDDLAEQLDDFLGARAVPPDSALFYVSARATRAEGELVLLLDPAHPETGDALGDVVGALSEGMVGPVVVIVDLRVDPRAGELEAMELARLARIAVRAEGVELIAAVRKLEPDEELRAQRCSPFTRALLRALDGADPAEGATAVWLYEAIREDPDVLESVAALAHVAVDESFVLVPGVGHDEPEVEEDEPDPEVATPSPPAADVVVAAPPDAEEEQAADVPASQAAPGPPPEAAASAPPPEVVALAPASTVPASAAQPSQSAPPPPASPSAPPPGARDVMTEGDALAKAGNDEEALARYRKALGLAASGAGHDGDRAEIYVRIGDVKLRQGKRREAIAGYEKALALNADLPQAGNVMKALLGLYFGEKDHRAASSIQQKLLARMDDPAESAAALLAFARSWLEDVGDPLRAREALEQAAVLAPSNIECHRMLLEIATREGRVDDALAERRRVADLEQRPKERAAALYALARELVQKHRREDEALDVLEAALEAEPSQVEPLALLSELLGERQEWSELEGAYRRMLDRLPRVEDARLRAKVTHELNRRLGLLLADHLEDFEGAAEAFEAAVRAKPRDEDVRNKVIALSKLVGQTDRALRHTQALTALHPLRPEPHHALFDLLMRTEQLERAAEAAAVLSWLGAATDRERAVLGAQSREERPQGALTDADWPILRLDLDPAGAEPTVELVARILSLATAPIVGSLVAVATRANRLPPLDEAQRVDATASTVSAARCLAWASGALGLPVPAVYLDDASSLGMTPCLRESPTAVIGAGALRGRSLEELSFLAGYHMVLQRQEHRLVRLSAQSDDLAACFVAAIVSVVPDTPVPERLAPLVDLLLPELEARLQAEGGELLDEAVLEFDAAGARADLGAYAEAVERAALRAGLLLCGKLPVAIEMARRLPGGEDLAAEREAELLAFTVSEEAAALRERLGVYDDG